MSGSSMNQTVGEGPQKYLSSSEEGRNSKSIIATGAVFSILPAIAVILRFYCHLRVTRDKVGIDDWLMLGSLVLTVGLGLMLIIGGALQALAAPTPQGWDKDDYMWVTNDDEIITEKLFWAFNLVQEFSFGLAKLSVLFFYRRIFVSPVFKAINTALMVIVSVWSVGFFFAYMFRCGTNFWALWAPLKDLLKYCYKSTPYFYAMCVSDVATDVFILSLPIFWICKLRMTPGKKLGVMGVFLLGAVELATGILRLVIYVQQAADPYQNADGIGHLTTMMFYTMIEMGIAVIAGCLPILWPLINKMSLESMVRTVRSALSLESLRESLGRGSLGSRGSRSRGRGGRSGDGSGGVPSSKWQNGSGGELDDMGSSRKLSDGVSLEHQEGRWPSGSLEQGRGQGYGQGQGGVQLDRYVEVSREPAAEGEAWDGSLPLQDLDARSGTVTHVSSPREAHMSSPRRV